MGMYSDFYKTLEIYCGTIYTTLEIESPLFERKIFQKSPEKPMALLLPLKRLQDIKVYLHFIGPYILNGI